MGNALKASYIDVHEAARCGHIEEVRRWIDEGKPVDARDNTQKTPLHHAAQWGQEEALDFLVECGANVNAADFIEDTPLHFACYFGHANCARILIKAGANVNAQDCYGNAPPQLFDDHVPEPVVDEIRLMVREVIRPPLALQQANSRETVTALCIRSDRSSDLALVPTVRSPGPSALSCATADGEEAVRAEATETANRRRSAHLDCHGDKIDRSNCVDGRQGFQPPRVWDIPERSQTSPANGSIISQEQQQQQQGQAVTTSDETVGEERPETTKAASAATREDPFNPVTRVINGNVLPRLSTVLPGDEELGHKDLRRPVRQIWDNGISGGTLSARGDGRRIDDAQSGGDYAVATYPGLRPLSAPPMGTESGSRKVHVTNFSPSGRSYSSATVCGATKNASMVGMSLEGALLAYATRPGGKLDVFAAARDGQVSVLKKALESGEKVDALDDNGLTSLMWAARAGRLSTAKYLVSQGAKLELRDNSTGFSALHFAAFYCRSSVVRVLLLAGANTRATDNRGRVPGARYQPSSYLSFTAFQQRRAIRRFLSGDLQDRMDDKGKTMFPMHAPLEAYDEDHKPQCVRLGSSHHMEASADQSSDGCDERTSATNQSGSKSARPLEPTTRHRSSDMARKADTGLKYLEDSNGPENLSDEEETSRASEEGYRRRKTNGASARSGTRWGETGVLYYLRRVLLVNALNRRNRIDCRDDDDGYGAEGRSGNGSRVRSNGSETTGGGVKYYLRRASAKSLSFDLSKLIVDGGDDGGGSNGAGALGRDDGEASITMAMAAAVSAATADILGGSPKSRNDDEDVTLDRVEASHLRRRRSSRGSDGGGNGGGESAIAGRRLSMKFLGGIQEGAEDLAAQFAAKDDNSCEGDSYGVRESGSHRVVSDVEMFKGSVITRQGRDEEEGLPEAGRRIKPREAQPSQSIEKEKTVVSERHGSQGPATASFLPRPRSDELLPQNSAGVSTGDDPAPCNCTVSTTDRPTASMALPRVDPSAPTWLPQAIGSVAITKKCAEPLTKNSDDADWRNRDLPSDAAKIKAGASQIPIRTAKKLPKPFDSADPASRESLKALRSDGRLRSGKEAEDLVSHNTVVGIEDSSARARDYVSLDRGVATEPISRSDGVVKPRTGVSQEGDTEREQKLSACGFSPMPGLTGELEEVCAKRQGTPTTKIIASVPAEHVKAGTLNVNKRPSVVDARVAVATPRMKRATSDVDSFFGDAASHAERAETKRGTISPRDFAQFSKRFDRSEKLGLDAGAPTSSPPSPGETISAGSGIYSEPMGERETTIRQSDSSARSGRKRHLRGKHKRRRDKEESESRSSCGKRQNKDRSVGEEVSGDRAREGEDGVAGDVRISPYPSPAAQVLAPLKQTSSPHRMVVACGDQKYEEKH